MRWYKKRVPLHHPEFGKLFPCECQKDSPMPKQVALLAKLRNELGALANCTFENFTLERPFRQNVEWGGETFEPEQQRRDLQAAYNATTAWIKNPTGWLYIYGSYGAGKSHLAAAAANYMATNNKPTTYSSVPMLLDFIRSGYGDNTATERAEALHTAPFLVLDDLGAESRKRDTDELLFQMINQRYLLNLPTIFTSNIHPDDLEPRIADRIYGQTNGGIRIIWMAIASYRRQRPR